MDLYIFYYLQNVNGKISNFAHFLGKIIKNSSRQFENFPSIILFNILLYKFLNFLLCTSLSLLFFIFTFLKFGDLPCLYFQINNFQHYRHINYFQHIHYYNCHFYSLL